MKAQHPEREFSSESSILSDSIKERNDSDDEKGS